ncbi:HNH endonuclease domain protein [Arthrobacter phage CapnMurica]|uniref:HNH endonuclease domain protein n=1 Tax=Arthrobacter phage CapnMurica TaxID=1772294 RepID=A0A0U4B1S3_9CAUD|nr:HNH endonuclease [Arthrobacter phage CaptnMurica]ALY08672.1 HNH endonuclease domain protein [Arthrobacter phage CaptnMurica]
MSVWRTLPEFPDYEITSDGDVRNRDTWYVLKEVQNKNTGAWSYSLRRPDGRSTQRNFWSLIYSAWPELKPADDAPKDVRRSPARQYAERGRWKAIPGFPNYEAHPEGLVRYIKTRKPRKMKYEKRGEKYFRLFNEYGDYSDVKLSVILDRTFEQKVEV